MIELTLLNKMAAYMVAPMSCKEICTTDSIFIHVLIYIYTCTCKHFASLREAGSVRHWPSVKLSPTIILSYKPVCSYTFFGPSLWKTMQPAWHMSDFHCQWQIMSIGSSCLHFFRICDVVASNPNYCHACYFGQNEKLKRKIC